MTKVLVSPVGLYKSRVIKGIKWLHPEWIFLLVNKGKENDPWVSVTRSFADEILAQIKFFYEERARIVLCNYESHQSFFQDIMTLVAETIPSKVGNHTEIWIDITSVPEIQEVAIMILAALCKNVKLLYTGARKPLLPDEYPERVRTDSGGVTFEMPIVRSVPLEDIEDTKIEEVLVAIRETFVKDKEGVKGFAALLKRINWSTEKVNYMRLGRIVDDLKKYGLVEVNRINREKRIKLTLGGEMLSHYLYQRQIRS